MGNKLKEGAVFRKRIREGKEKLSDYTCPFCNRYMWLVGEKYGGPLFRCSFCGSIGYTKDGEWLTWHIPKCLTSDSKVKQVGRRKKG